jgi:hypothetical protein
MGGKSLPVARPSLIVGVAQARQLVQQEVRAARQEHHAVAGLLGARYQVERALEQGWAHDVVERLVGEVEEAVLADALVAAKQ